MTPKLEGDLLTQLTLAQPNTQHNTKQHTNSVTCITPQDHKPKQLRTDSTTTQEKVSRQRDTYLDINRRRLDTIHRSLSVPAIVRCSIARQLLSVELCHHPARIERDTSTGGGGTTGLVCKYPPPGGYPMHYPPPGGGGRGYPCHPSHARPAVVESSPPTLPATV